MTARTAGSAAKPHPALTAVVWAWVAVPFGYGLYQLLIKIPALFGS
jgi:hypothetical protein